MLFLILIAVVLFAALSFAVTQTRENGSNLTDSKARIGAAAFLSYISDIRRGTNKLIANGVDPYQVDFRRPVLDVDSYLAGSKASIWETNTDCTKTSCRVFEKDGGGVIPKIYDLLVYGAPNWVNFAGSGAPIPGRGIMRAMQFPNTPSTANDYVINFQLLDNKVCDAIQTITGSGTMTTSGSSNNLQGGSYKTIMDSGTLVGTPVDSGDIYNDVFVRYNANDCAIWALILGL